jgi:hypothetical protein
MSWQDRAVTLLVVALAVALGILASIGVVAIFMFIFAHS